MAPRLKNGLVCLAGVLLVPALWAGPVIDGQNIPSDFGTAALLASQRFQTSFGDDQSGDQWGNGSELDQLFVSNDTDYLYIGLSGNLENNGNCIAIFIDVDGGATGAHELFTKDFGEPIDSLPRFLGGDTDPMHPGFDNILFDAGFAPNYVLGFSGGSPLGSQTRSYYLVDWSTLALGGNPWTHSNEIAGMITAGDATASGPAGTLGDFLATASLGILGAADNSGVAGVEGNLDPNTPPQLATADPASQTTGFEFAIPLSLLNVGIGDSVCLFAAVSSGDGWISNQLLPTGQTETEFDSIGNRGGGIDQLDFATISGDQFACYTLSEPQGCPNPGESGRFCTADIDGSGDCVVDLSDLAQLLSNYGTTSGATHDDGDLDGDGDVDLSDLAELLGQYGDDCN